MPYSEQVIDQVQSANDIVEVISGHLPLKRAGRNFKVCCPFHQEKTPSFVVNPDKQIFHCFGCGVGGDIFSFLMKYDQLNFPEAVRHLAEQANITLPELSKSAPENRSQNERLYQMYSLAVEFYHAELIHPERGRAARAYLAKRNFGEKEIKTFQLGLATQEWRDLLTLLTKKGFKEQELLRSGLIVRSQKGHIFDIFRSRVMFPIMNAQGKVIAFGGRILGDGLPKYLNSPESTIFQKRKEMYALNWAKRAIQAMGDTRRVIVTEGYLDCIRLHVNGFQNAVATLGTALTPEHVRVLKRYADGAIVVFDGDKAGVQASLRSLDTFLEEGMEVKVIGLPQGFDADDLIDRKGKEVMAQLIEEARDVFDFKLQVMLSRYNKADSLGLLKITSEFLDTFSLVKSPVLVDRYLKRLARTLGVEETSLRMELAKLKQKQGGMRIPSSVSRVALPPQQKKEQGVSLEKTLISLFLHYPPYLATFGETFPDFTFLNPKARETFRLLEQMTKGDAEQAFSVSKLLNRIQDEQLKGYVSHLLVTEWSSGEDREQAFQDCLNAVRGQARSVRLQALRNQISQAEDAGQEDLVLKYMKAYQALLEQVE